MNKVIDSMLASVSPEMTDQAADFLSTIASAMDSQLLPAKVRAELPPLGATEDEGDPFAIVRFFQPDGQWVWYATEFDGDDTLFGLVQGFEDELGYFSLSELETATGALGLSVERDTSFEPTRLSALR